MLNRRLEPYILDRKYDDSETKKSHIRTQRVLYLIRKFGHQVMMGVSQGKVLRRHVSVSSQRIVAAGYYLSPCCHFRPRILADVLYGVEMRIQLFCPTNTKTNNGEMHVLCCTARYV